MLKENPQPDRDIVRTAFLTSDRFEPLMSKTHAFLDTNPRRNRIDFQNSFAGKLFEEMGYLWLKTQIGSDMRLLNPDETLEYFLALHRGLPSQALLQGGILNEYVPDGLILGDGNDKGDAVIVEYTARGRNSALPKYIHHKSAMVGTLRKRYPEIFGKGSLQIIFTQDTHSTIKNTRGVDPRTTLRPAPYNHDEVHAFAQELVGAHFVAGK